MASTVPIGQWSAGSSPVWPGAPNGTKRSAGTNTSSATTVLLAVPHIPATCQVSSIDRSLNGIIAVPNPVTSPASSSTSTPPMNEVAWNEPEAKPQLPVTR